MFTEFIPSFFLLNTHNAKAFCVAKDERGEFAAARARSLQNLGVEGFITRAKTQIWLAREYVYICGRM